MELKTVLRDLCTANGVNGCKEAADLARNFLSTYTRDIHSDAMGNVLGIIPCGDPTAPTILLEAHVDEIGFVVTQVDERGFLRVSECGGIDNRALSAAPVTVLCNPPVNGVFAMVPSHLAKEDTPLPQVTERVIDIGAENAKHVTVGTRVAFRSHFEELCNERVCDKALDNRAGVAAVLRTLDLLKDETLPFNIAVSFCTQEELGLRGAKTAAYSVRPDAAIVVDVSFAYTPDADKTQCGVLGNGTMIGMSPVLNRHMTDTLHALAEKQNIAYQWEVTGGMTGTDADVTSVTAEGIPTALLSVPLRYMHTPVEVVSVADIEATAQLMAAYIRKGEVPTHA